ncbi:unnamed protein product [Periconia digitata]|uniref:Secreted protein n=1 Tax=Periconia digitata TaxID=1303443 RepID=A0A9W4XU07_9PLEO|nr:unnamed protein product [Periconia digitata]
MLPNPVIAYYKFPLTTIVILLQLLARPGGCDWPPLVSSCYSRQGALTEHFGRRTIALLPCAHLTPWYSCVLG